MRLVVDARRRRVKMLMETDGGRQRFASGRQEFARPAGRRQRHDGLDDRRRRHDQRSRTVPVAAQTPFAFVGAERRIDGGPGLPVVQLPRVFLQVEIAAESFPANPASELFCNQMISLLLMEL